MNPLREVPHYAWRNLTHQGLRSYLTLLGVVIGIASIVTLFALGAGLSNAVNEQFERLGANTIYVTPSSLFQGSSPTSFTNVKVIPPSLVEKIRSLPEVSYVLPNVYSLGTLSVGREQAQAYVLAISPSDAQLYVDSGFMELREGRLFDDRDVFSVIIGNEYVDQDIFTKSIRLGSRVYIEGKSFTVIGITKPTQAIAGDPASANNALFIPSKGFSQLFANTDPLFLIVKTNTVEDIPLAKERIDRLLEKEFGRDQKVFEAATSEQLQAQVGDLVAVIQLVLVGIASISLLVGGIGIANTMVMSIMERTEEIGVMKAVGATNTLVMFLFLLEAGFIGLVGGIIGLVIGYTLAFLIQVIATSSGFALLIRIDILVILGALIFAVGVGMLSGLLPARRAALMDPVEALRGTK
ncbi:MAG: ABC transporter permease [Candidatus Diapherotrites archaeon]|nr:ABC transporter permease [Candidatus Diapherotrites archaeon]